jgi:abortive infection bacteriophage resistance protein
MSSGPSLPVSYSKSWLSVSAQISKLESRGLKVSDKADAESFLRHINYYRFTGYCLAFEDTRHSFKAGVSFDHIKHAYQFDASLRDLFTEGLELIEIDLRTSIAHYLGSQYGAFGHIDPTTFHHRFDFKVDHSSWLNKLHDETTRSREIFVNHFRKRYSEYPNLPIWAATEVMSFGGLSRMVRAMHKKDRNIIAAEYDVPQKILSSVTHHFAYVRNLCAHHCRLWDRVWSVKSDLPHTKNWKTPYPVSNRRLFSTLLLMRKLMQRSSGIKSQGDDWRDRVTDLLRSPPNVETASSLLGLINKWQEHPVWK